MCASRRLPSDPSGASVQPQERVRPDCCLRNRLGRVKRAAETGGRWTRPVPGDRPPHPDPVPGARWAVPGGQAAGGPVRALRRRQSEAGRELLESLHARVGAGDRCGGLGRHGPVAVREGGSGRAAGE